ncbi:MAG: CaiB/BaiF CoA-transferase family protein [Nitriliruptoraceae bacterium]
MSNTKTPARSGPLTDLRVIEMGQLLAGPFCGQLLADFGADVIKIEQPNVGDPMRQWGADRADGHSLWWSVVARNKQSVTLDLRREEGQQIVRELAAHADVLLENFRPGTLERWNLGYDLLSEINPRLVMVRVSGYGQDGPYASRAGYGAIGEAMGGLRYTTGDPDKAPSRTGISIGDSLAAVYATMGTMFALHARERTGRGQVVDAAIYESVLAMMESLVIDYDVADYTRERTGAILPKISPSNVYPCTNGESILIAANMDTVFRRLTQVMGRPELADDERYNNHGARGARQTELDELIAAYTATRDAQELLDELETAGVPAGRIYRASDMLTDPHFLAREAITRVMHPALGDVAMQNITPRLSATPGEIRHVGPKLGEHNLQVLADVLGYSQEQVADLITEGIVGEPPQT